ncbi:MAG TPA: M23 family metallopeptidase [Chthoniobacterales bacterium]|nr:M23 family metallopeptidase [Chthoniobacterales bacterium]
MTRAFFVVSVGLIVLCANIFAQTESATVVLALPTDNDAIFHGGGADFYQYIERDYHGEKSYPWEGGQYGFVRDPEPTSAGTVYTRFHEGIDIRPMHRDERGEPFDEIRAIADGKVVYTNSVPGRSNYGKYIVIEHNWGSSPYYSLYGHLSKIDIHVGDAVHRGQHIAVMGYTGVGINRERAHVHLELNLMLSRKFQEWYDAYVHPSDPNHHGIYNGINLTGLNVARLYLELREKPSLTIPQFLSEEAIFYKVALPGSRHFELPKTYPWMVNGNAANEPRSWTVSFARSGLPLRIEPSDRKVKEPELVYVKASLRSASFLIDGIAAGPAGHAHLTEHGKQMLHLLIYPD